MPASAAAGGGPADSAIPPHASAGSTLAAAGIVDAGHPRPVISQKTVFPGCRLQARAKLEEDIRVVSCVSRDLIFMFGFRAFP